MKLGYKFKEQFAFIGQLVTYTSTNQTKFQRYVTAPQVVVKTLKEDCLSHQPYLIEFPTF